MKKRFQIPIEINGKNFLIKPYTSNIEKDILIMSSFGIFDLDEVLRILDLDENIIKSLSQNEKKVMLYKYREVSLGDEIEIKYNCKHCNKTNVTSLIASDFVIESKLNDADVLKIDKEVTENNLNDFLTSNVDLMELDIDEYEELITRIKNNQSKFDFIKSRNCVFCKCENLFDIGSEKYIIEQLSDHSLMTIYKTYKNMMMFGNISKSDIDEMYPFERAIFIGLISETKEGISK